MNATKEQRAVYTAEQEALSRFPASRLASELVGRWGDLLVGADVYVGYVCNQPWFKDAFPGVHRPLVTSKRGHRSDYADCVIRLSREIGSTRDVEATCLHELAHHVTSRKDDSSSHGHHRAWRVNYIFLVNRMIGYRAARYLRNAFEDAGLPTR